MPKAAIHTSALDAILDASPIVQLTMLALIFLSIMCWAIAFYKMRQLKKIKSSNEAFGLQFWKTDSLDELYEAIDEYPDSSHARVFKAGFTEMQKLLSKKNSSDKVQLTGIDNLERALRKAMDTEVESMEYRLTWLATTGSTGPFIGLFGTVWGIMTSFQKIGATGSASLAVVAPGISEALIATAIGLAAAIPAVMLYNHFISLIKKEETALNNFSADFLNISKRNFFKEH